MNTLFNSALRQSNSIRKELGAVGEAPAASSPAVYGQLNASLTSFSRTIDEYNNLAKQEIVPEKQEKAFSRVKNFRSELADFREQLEKLRKEQEESQISQARTDLLGGGSHRRAHNANSTDTPQGSNPYANPSTSGPFQPRAGGSSFGAGPQDYTRETHALREQSFMSQTNAALDEYLDRGRAVLSDLGQQREILKGTQKRLYNVANTLGVSGDTIRMVERRAKQDKWIFYAGVIGFFGFCWLVLHYLR